MDADALAGAFVTAVGRRFPSPPTREEVTDPCCTDPREVCDRRRATPMLGESLVRSGFGGTGLLTSELTRGQTLMTYGIVNDLGLHGDALEEFLTEAAEEYLGRTE